MVDWRRKRKRVVVRIVGMEAMGLDWEVSERER